MQSVVKYDKYEPLLRL